MAMIGAGVFLAVVIFPFVVGAYYLIWPTKEKKSQWVNDRGWWPNV